MKSLILSKKLHLVNILTWTKCTLVWRLHLMRDLDQLSIILKMPAGNTIWISKTLKTRLLLFNKTLVKIMALRCFNQNSQLWKLDLKILDNKQWVWLNHLIQDQYQILRKPLQTSQKKCQFLMLLKKRLLKWMIFIQNWKISLRNLINLLTSVIWKWQS